MSPVVSARRLSPFRVLSFLFANAIWIAALFLAPATNASAQLTVTTLADSTDAGCTATCSLRDAITAADLAPGSTITFQGGLTGTIPLGSALPAITANMTITGPGANLVTISGGGTVPAFSVVGGATAITVSISGLTVSNTAGGFSASGYGSGLFLQAASTGTVTVTLDSMVFSNNAGASGGAAITNDGGNLGTLNVTNTTFSGNNAPEGGAVYNNGTLNVSTSTFSSNIASVEGSAIINAFGGVTQPAILTISDSTFANNTAQSASGGGVYNSGGTLTVRDSTFSGNLPAIGGSIANGGTLTLANTIIVEPTGSSIECTGTGCTANPTNPADVNGNLDDVNTNLKLSALGFYGGPTETLVPQSGSPAICTGITADDGGITTDQRGFPLDGSCAGTIDSGSVQLTSLVVTNTNDSGTGSLRAAITTANAGEGDITFQSGVTGTINLASVLPSIEGVVNITGPGTGLLTINAPTGAAADRIFFVDHPGTLTLVGMTLENGNATNAATDPNIGGGAILNANVLNVSSVVFNNNNAGAGRGGAIYNDDSTLQLVNDCTFTNNTSGDNGGAIESSGPLPTISNSTFSANNTGNNGSAIDDNASSPLTVSYSTFSGNTATGYAAISSLAGALTVVNDTFSGNTGGGGAGDLYNDAGTMVVQNSVEAVAGQCAGTGCPTNKTAGNIVADAALTLAALGNYGGPTATILPLPGSSAICGGLAADIPSGVTADQRGFSNVGPASYVPANCVDSGSVQTDYTAVEFVNPGAPYIGSVDIAGTTPPVVVSVTENGQNIGGVPVTLIFTGTGTATGLTATTVGGTGATFSGLTVDTVATGDDLSVSMLVVGTDTLAAGPEPLTIQAAGTTATNTTEAAPLPAGFDVSTTAVSVTLNASVTSTATVSAGYVTFTVHSGSPTGAVVGTAVGSVPVTGGTTGNVTYTIPANTVAGTYYIVAAYTDPGGSLESSNDSSKTIVINAAVTATTAIPTTTLTAGVAATAFTPVTGAGGTAPLSYSVLPALPSALTMSATTGQITGTPAAASAATVYTVTVKDANNATATATFTLTVNGVVSATTAVPTTTLTAGVAATAFTPVTGAGGTGALTYSVLPALPSALTMSATTGQITGTPAAASAARVYTVTVKDANNATATATFTLTVNGVVTATTAIPTTTLTTGVAATAFTPVTGAGGTTPLTYSVLPALPSALTMSTTTGQITGTPAAASAATVYTVTVKDANNATATATFTLTVNGVVTATTAVPTTTLTAGIAATAFTPVTGAGGTAPLSYSVLPALPSVLTMSATTGQITGTPAAASAATVYTVTVKDANNATATATFTLTVNGVVTATTAVPTTTLTAGVAATAFTPVTGAGGTGALTYSVLPALPSALTMSATTGQITGTPAAASATTVYTVTVKDTNNATATATFTLTVNGALSATTAIPTTTLTAGHAATAFTPVTGAGGTAPLTYSVLPALPSALTMSATTGQITGTPAAASAATVYTVTVKDANNATVTATFSLTVNTVVTATTAVPTTILTQNHVVTAFTPVTGGGGTAPLSYGVAPALPTGLLYNLTTGQITGTPTVASAATTYTVTVTDANGETATATFSLTVSGAVSATTAVPTTILTEGHLATAFTPVTGAGGTAPLTFGVAPVLPAGLTMSTTTGQITGTPTVVSAATTYTVTVTDADNATATATFSLTVNGSLTATTAVPTTTLLADQPATPFTPVTGAGGTAPLTYGVAPALPAGLTMSTTTGQITGTPTVTTNATTYTVTVTDANGATATATFSLTVNSATISITWANPSAITYGTSLAGVLDATVVYNGNTVSGTFAYTAQLTGGSAVPVTAATVLADGSYTLTASFTPSNTTTYGTPAPKSVPLTVNQAQPTITWTPATSIPYGTSLAALLNATASFGGNSVAGSFAYTAQATGGSAVAVTGATVLVEGTYTLAVTFTPTTGTDYKTATASSPLAVTGGTLTVTASNATKVYGTANPTFTGTITGQQNGDTFTESFATTATTTSNVGTYPIVPSATGANLSDYTVVIDDGTLTVTQAGSTTALTASGNTINPGATLTLTATVASATSGTPTGTVSFYDGSTLLDTATLTAGVATYSTTALLSGSHTITAVYSGDTNFTASSTSSALTITVPSLDFTMTAAPTTQSGQAGNTFNYDLTLTPTFGTYPGAVSFAANGGPTGAVISFGPSTLAANSGTQTVYMSVATAAGSSALQPLDIGRKLAPVALAFLLLPFAGTRRMRRHGRRFGRLICLLLLALGCVAATTALSGCGSSPGGSSKTGGGTNYTITVTATSGTVTHTSTVTLTLQ
jgi:CSLREA domain-containing protein